MEVAVEAPPVDESASAVDVAVVTDNPNNFYCGISRRDAAGHCLPCASGSSNECADASHKCFRGIGRCARPSASPGGSGEAGAAAESTSGTAGVSASGPEDETYAVTDSTDYASELASNLRVMVDMGAKYDHGEDCSLGDWGLCYTQTLTLEYTGASSYLDKQFQIYFSAIHRVLQVNHPDFEHNHVVGDLTYIQPTSSFQGFQPNAKIVIPIVREYWSVQETDNMPRWFVVDDRDGSTAVIANTDTEDLHGFVAPYTSTMKTPTDANVHMTASSRFSLNQKLVKEVDFGDRIIPAPYRTVVGSNAAEFVVGGIHVRNLQLLGNLMIGIMDLESKLGIDDGPNNSHEVDLVIGPLSSDVAGPGAYTLEVTASGTAITGTDAPGLFHGLVSFFGLLDPSQSNNILKEMLIHDKPRFDYRGHQVDVARNFRSKQAIMKTIDAMALYKLNVLHLALTNDEGWRLEIPGLEELTTVGSRRCFDPQENTCLLTQLGSGPDAEGGLFYTRDEYVELLKYAAERNVKIIPEFNMPAHARAAVVAMEARARNGDDSYRLTDPEDETYLLTIQLYDRTSIINPCLDSSVRFVEKVVAEVKQMHDEAGVPLDRYHFGGDEAKNIMLGAGYASYPEELKQPPFSKSPACHAKTLADPTFDVSKIANYWAVMVNRILADHGIGEMFAWEDGLRGTTKAQYATQSVAVNFWETLFWGGIDGLADISDDGFDIIMSNPDYLYFDFPYEVDPEERGYYWAARQNSVYKVFTFAPENLAQNAETSTDRDGNEMTVTTPSVVEPTIHGMQGQTWSETIRTDEQYFEMAFPRVLAVAERAWHRASWELDWAPGETYNLSSGRVPMDELAADFNGFASALGCREVAKLEKLGIGYRVPPPGASVDASGMLTVNSELPCTVTMYSTDGGGTWTEYFVPVGVGVNSVVSLQSVSPNGALKSRVVVADGECDDCESVDRPVESQTGTTSTVGTQIGTTTTPAADVSVDGSTTEYASELASNLRVTVGMGANFDHGEDCSLGDWGLCYTQTLTLEYAGPAAYLDKQFQIYFSAIHRVLQVNHPDFEHTHVVGDLTYIQPTSSFQGFQPNVKIVIPIVREYWSVQETDNMPRWFVVDDRDGSTAVIANTDTEDLHEFVAPYTSTMKTPTDANVHMTASSRFSLNQKLVAEANFSERIIPAPYRTVVGSNAVGFVIGGINVQNMQLLGTLMAGAYDLMQKLGVDGGAANAYSVTLFIGSPDGAGPESYTMEVTASGTAITGTDAPGLFHGLMSFFGLLDSSQSNNVLKEMTIHDKPRFDYRGHQVDVARNFRSKQAIMKTIDAMALYKLNVLHLALTNDEGWRLEIPGLEELTTVGSKRCFDLEESTCLLTQLGSGPDAEGGLFYTRDEYVELLKYAAERNVKIIPEFNMPAHARAAVVAMEARARNGDDSYRLTDPEDETYLLTIQLYDRTSIINPCLDSSVRFVEKVVAEVKQMHDEAGVPLDRYHFGGDEAKNIMLGAGYASYPEELKQPPFSKSPACHAKTLADPTFDVSKIANYWAVMVNRILADHGIGEMFAWEDGLRGTTKAQYATQSVAVNFWETLFWGGIDGLADISDDGFDIIMSNPDYLYFDFPYEVDPRERGYYWAARQNSVYKVFTFAPENLAQNAETSTDRDGNEMTVTTPSVFAPTIHGMQGQTWSETIRTDEQYFEMAFPRVLAVAERAWHRASWELDWSPGETYNLSSGRVPKDELAADFNGFASALGCREVAKLEKLGIGYRVPPPGASVDASGMLTVNSELPCTVTMYSTDGGGTWTEYFVPVGVGVGSVVSLQSVSPNGALKSRIVVADGECDDCESVDRPVESQTGTTSTVGAQIGTATTSAADISVDGSTTEYASELASNLRVTVGMGANFDHGEDCSLGDWGLCYTQTLTLEYAGASSYLDKQFQIYFSAIHRVLQVNHPDFEHTHVVGDLTYIQPTSSFQGFQPNSRIVIPIVREYWSVQETDNMPRWFVVDDRDGSTAVIANTDTEDLHGFVAPYTSTMKTPTDANVHMTASSRFSLNQKLVTAVDFSERIIPAPYQTVVGDSTATFVVSGVDIQNLQLLGNLRMGAMDLGWTLGIGGGSVDPHTVVLNIGALPTEIAGPESYKMEVTASGTAITGTDAPGLFHGLMSFFGLFDVTNMGSTTLREMTVHDKPRFDYRGHQVDVARNFRSKQAIMKTIDAMALYKLNVLHLALTNDEGWRLEIPGLEELTTIGSRRCFDLQESTCLLTQLGSGPDAEEGMFYTRDEYVELLKYAAERNVKIIPEFNMPAHARAAVVAMEARARNGDDSYRLTDPEDDTYLLTIQLYDRTSIINPCLDSSVRFVEKVVAEVKGMHDEAGVLLDHYHFGGDEAKNIMLGAGYASYPEELKQPPFSKSPACQAKTLADPTFDVTKIANYWAVTVNRILADHGIGEMLAWEDGLRGTTKAQYATQSVAVNFWETLFWGGIDGLADISNDGFDIIMSNPDYLYFDFPYEVDPEERGYYWAARQNSVYKVFTFAPENLAQNAETSTDRDGNEMTVTTPSVFEPTIHGMQGQTWSETIRTDEQYFEMAFPRVLAVAERAWHRASWELDWSPGETYNLSSGRVPKDELAADFNGFASALGCREVAKLEKLGIGYRVPPPGASVDASGMLTVNSELPCTVTMYSTDGGGTWTEYFVPVGVGVGSVVSLQSVSPNGALKSRIVVADGECDDCESVDRPVESQTGTTSTVGAQIGTATTSAADISVDGSTTEYASELASNLRVT
ncbi:hypothetical protein ACHAXT_008039, partial [Thalassiosira profunda]